MSVDILGAVILLVCLFPPFIPAVIAAGCIAALVAGMYIRVVVSYTRLELQAYGPLSTHVGAILAGGQVIRTLGRKEDFLRVAGGMIERLGATNFASYALNRWYGRFLICRHVQNMC